MLASSQRCPKSCRRSWRPRAAGRDPRDGGGHHAHACHLAGQRCPAGALGCRQGNSTAAILAGGRGMILVGTAGSLRPNVESGDVVVATELLQHDLDAPPLWGPVGIAGRRVARVSRGPLPHCGTRGGSGRRLFGAPRRAVRARFRRARGAPRPGDLGGPVSSPPEQSPATRKISPMPSRWKMEGAAVAQVSPPAGPVRGGQDHLGSRRPQCHRRLPVS